MAAYSRSRILIIFISLIVFGVSLIMLATLKQGPPEPQIDQGSTADVPRVSVANARAALALKQAVFVDVRDKSQYEASHVADAISLPLSELESRWHELDQERWIITYCS